MSGPLPYHCPEHKSDHLISPCVKQLARIEAMGKAGLIWLGPLEKCVACQGKKLIIREAPSPMNSAVLPQEKDEEMGEVVKFKSVEEANKYLGPEKLMGMNGDVAGSAAPAPIKIQFCKNHPEVEAHKNKHGRYMGLCLECLRGRAARNSRNRGGKTAKEKMTPAVARTLAKKQERAPMPPAEPADSHGSVRPLYSEQYLPVCKNHPTIPARIDSLGRSMGLCAECLIARGRASGTKNTAMGLTSPPVAIPLNQAQYAEIRQWLEEQAAEDERTLLREIMYRLKLAMREASVCG